MPADSNWGESESVLPHILHPLVCFFAPLAHVPFLQPVPLRQSPKRSGRLCTSQLEMHLAIDAGMGGSGLSHDSFGARMGGTPERLYKCTQENLQVSTTNPPLSVK